MFTNEINMDWPLQGWVKKTVFGMETHWLSGKEKVPGAADSKKGDADFWDRKGPLTIDSLEKLQL